LAVDTLSLFDDRIVSSSDLNRRSGEVLRSALDRPITITRADGDLVLMRRTLAAELVRAASAWPRVVTALARLVATLSDEPLNPRLVDGLDVADLTTLGLELAHALEHGRNNEEGMSEASAVLYEWEETLKWLEDPVAKSKIASAEHAVRKGRGERDVPAEPPVLPSDG
jgi:hypothetical protein